jgi:hypothetical protein
MRQGIQTLFSEAGEAGCYAFSIIEIAERVMGRAIGPVYAMYEGIARGYIYYNDMDKNDNDNFFVRNPPAFLSFLTGIQWAVEIVPSSYTAKPGEYVVDRWERKQTGIVSAHFRIPDWDSLHNSQTVKYGKIVSKRVFRRIG